MKRQSKRLIVFVTLLALAGMMLCGCGAITRYVGNRIAEDTIERVTDAKREYGSRCTLLGGIDVDFLCRADEPAIRQRVRRTLDVCMPGGGYCLGSGNSVANYVPVDNYLAMLDEGRRYR